MTRSLLATLILSLGGVRVAAQENTPRIPRQAAPTTGAIVGFVQDDQRLGLGNAELTVRNEATNQMITARTTGDGVVRLMNVQPGQYSVRVTLERFQLYEKDNLVVRAGELVDVMITLMPSEPPASMRAPIPPPEEQPAYRTLPGNQDNTLASNQGLPAGEAETRTTNRWKFDWPEYHRYGPQDEAPYIKGNWFDPFNRSKLKGDYPLFGQTFLNINLVNDTFNQFTQIPLPSGVDSARPQSSNFFGRFSQYALVENMAFQVTLFHGDTSFKPVDWQIRFTPDINLNYALVEENGILNVNPEKGTTRFDSHASLQEAFVEAKIHDLSDNYDFVSIRAGIQTFNSDFRGFIFFNQEPGARLFGNFASNRYQYNAVYFAMLEKDTNSALNTFDYKHQQVLVANLFRQDFIVPGYTIEASYHFNKDDPSIQFNTDNFLVRPSPIGAVYYNGALQTDAIRAHYIGVTGDGHIGRINVDHAFYQALGRESWNNLAQALRYYTTMRNINAQMAALELSLDEDWVRYRVSAFYSSGSKNPGSHTERGFDSILDNPNFAGGFFSFWIREGIRLLSTGLGLTQGNSLIPDLRTSKDEGQANFVNPGIFIYNAATNIKITPKLRGIINVNLIRFDHTETLQYLLFQSPIHAGVGADTGIGLTYRPFLTDNIVINGVFNAFVPFQGFRDIFTDQTLYSVAANVRFRF